MPAASEEKSRKAAEVLAGFESRFSKIEGDLTLLKWMTGTAIVLIVGGFGVMGRVLFEILSRLPHA